MTITMPIAQAITNLVNKDSALLEDLRNSSSRQEVTTKLAAAAQANGIGVDESALSQELNRTFDLYIKHGELTDEQLEEVAGGADPITLGAVALAIGGPLVVAAFTIPATAIATTVATVTAGVAVNALNNVVNKAMK